MWCLLVCNRKKHKTGIIYNVEYILVTNIYIYICIDKATSNQTFVDIMLLVVDLDWTGQRRTISKREWINKYMKYFDLKNIFYTYI